MADSERDLLHGAFERHAKQRNALALRWPGGEWTYGELNERSDRLAHVLRERGIGPETIVGVFFDRDPRWILSVLAILKAGAAFAPVDAALPDQRISDLFELCAAPVILTKRGLLDRLAGIPGEAIAVDQEDDERFRAQSKNFPCTADSRSAACVVFTSGSAGRPKAVLHEHAGLANQARVHRREYDVDNASRVLQFSPLTSANSVAEVFMALSAGACLVVLPSRAIAPGLDLINALREHDITHLHLTPSALATLPVQDLPSMRSLSVGGEPLEPAVAEPWADRCRLYHCYGTSECFWLAITPFQVGLTPPPIGRPIDGMQAWVVDERMQPQLGDSPGELYVGGVGLARGYLAKPPPEESSPFLDRSLTAERFLTKPFQGAPERLYRTGDRARFLSDGQLVLLGRIDRQVQIRGHRTEPAEVEAALARHLAVADSVVTSKPATDGEPRLVAYVVPHPGHPPPSLSSLREFLALRLPAAMVPKVVVHLDTIPLNSHNKIDFSALPEPTGERPVLDNDLVGPRSVTEAALVEIWEHVLGVQPVGIHDPFLELGGDSLKATRVASRFHAGHGVALSPADVLGCVSIEELSRRIDDLRCARE